METPLTFHTGHRPATYPTHIPVRSRWLALLIAGGLTLLHFAVYAADGAMPAPQAALSAATAASAQPPDSVSTTELPWASAMDDFIATALAQDPSIERARSNIAAAEEGVTAAKWQFGPTPSFSREPSSSGYVNVIRIQQPLFTGGALQAGLRSARIVVQGSQEELASAQMQLRLRLVTTWADWVKARQRVASLQTLASQHEELLAMIQRRTDAGVATVSDAALATSRLSAVQAELAQARLEEALQRQQLQRLARRPVEPPLAQALDGKLPDAPDLPTILDHIQTSPDMAIARASVDIAREDLNKAKASLLPTISLRLDHQTGAVRDQSIGLVMQASFGGGLASFSSVNAARHRILAAQAAVSATEQDLFNRYQLEFTRYASACASARSAVATAAASDVVLASYRRQFAAGKRAWLDLLNMVRESHAARQSQHDAAIEERASLYRLNVLLQAPGTELQAH